MSSYTYAFFTLPAHGHVHYSLAIAQELIARGQRVIYFLTEEFQTAVESSGATFRAYHDLSSLASHDTVSTLRQILQALSHEQPDYIVYDYMSAWASLLARTLGIAAISTRCTFATNNAFGWSDLHHYHSPLWSHQQAPSSMGQVEQALQGQVKLMCQALALPEQMYPRSPLELAQQREQLNISCIPRVFQPMVDTFDASYQFVGPAITTRPFQEDATLPPLPADQPLIYISLGTLFNNRTDILKACIKALGNTKWRVLLSRGQKSISASLGPVPRNITVARYVPQLNILTRSWLFISHAGFAGVGESLHAGVPMVAIPQIPEQAIVAQRLQDLGLGIACNPDTVSADDIRAAVERIAQNPTSYARQVGALPPESRDGRGHIRAADAILALAQSAHQRLTSSHAAQTIHVPRTASIAQNSNENHTQHVGA
jgi:MGT family glycosyltransferase